MIKNSVGVLPLIEIDTPYLDGSFNILTILHESCFMLRYINRSNKDIFISYNGRELHDIIPAQDSVQLLFNNKIGSQLGGFMYKDTTIYGSCVSNAKGSLYISGYYFIAGR